MCYGASKLSIHPYIRILRYRPISVTMRSRMAMHNFLQSAVCRCVEPVVLTRSEPLLPGTLIQRYKRFLADIRLEDGCTITAHCVNTGAMEGLTQPGIRVWVSRATNPNRKLQFTWELAEVDGRIYGVDTSLPNRVVGHLLRQRLLPGLKRWSELKPEKPYGQHSRIDFWLRQGSTQVYLEVKNCHLLYPDGFAYFPDCVSARATEHVGELTSLASAPGHQSQVLFVVQISGCRGVRPSDMHDPAFATAARCAGAAGVRFRALLVEHTPTEIRVQGLLPVDLRPYMLDRVQGWRAEALQRKCLAPPAPCVS